MRETPHYFPPNLTPTDMKPSFDSMTEAKNRVLGEIISELKSTYNRGEMVASDSFIISKTRIIYAENKSLITGMMHKVSGIYNMNGSKNISPEDTDNINQMIGEMMNSINY